MILVIIFYKFCFFLIMLKELREERIVLKGKPGCSAFSCLMDMRMFTSYFITDFAGKSKLSILVEVLTSSLFYSLQTIALEHRFWK